MRSLIVRRRFAGQMIVYLALVMGILCGAGALVVDYGTHTRVRIQTQQACDAAALAGMTEFIATHDGDRARERALALGALDGFKVGERGVTQVEAVGYNHLTWDGETHEPADPSDSDRYMVRISSELPQLFGNVLGRKRTGVSLFAVAALLNPAPMDVDVEAGGGTGGLGGQGLFGFPQNASVAHLGPDGSQQLGDAFATPLLDDGSPNPLYMEGGLTYDLHIPADLLASTGSSMVRVELFDPDTINNPAAAVHKNEKHVMMNPDPLADLDGDPREPEQGGMDEILSSPHGSNTNISPAEFASVSTQTEFTIYDHDMKAIATAVYGPNSNTPFWYQWEAPASRDAHIAANDDPAQAQLATDLHWVTPQAIRLSAQREDGVWYDPAVSGVTDSSALAVYARGRTVVNFMAIADSSYTMASVPADAGSVTISNFDTEVGSCTLTYSLDSMNKDTGEKYPVLLPADDNAAGRGVVSGTDGKRYYTEIIGTQSPNRQWRSDTILIPQTVSVPQTDGNGNLMFDAYGNVIIDGTRQFEGAEVNINYRGGAEGAADTSSWEVSYSTNKPQSGTQTVVLIR
ncbi:MAG: Tad domain-containing protein [Armatimonadetes bacterium]|nr:Tad domain-containing protein [Armatimonadota bacterium]